MQRIKKGILVKAKEHREANEETFVARDKEY